MWDAIEFHVHYSRRQAIRIHNEAIKKTRHYKHKLYVDGKLKDNK